MEKCDTDLRTLLKNNDLTLEQRKDIAVGVLKGAEYLSSIGIEHSDKKPENILLRNGVPKWIDFGVTVEKTGQKTRDNYRRMGYARSGAKYRRAEFLRKIRVR